PARTVPSVRSFPPVVRRVRTSPRAPARRRVCPGRRERYQIWSLPEARELRTGNLSLGLSLDTAARAPLYGCNSREREPLQGASLPVRARYVDSARSTPRHRVGGSRDSPDFPAARFARVNLLMQVPPGNLLEKVFQPERALTGRRDDDSVIFQHHVHGGIGFHSQLFRERCGDPEGQTVSPFLYLGLH